MEPSSLTFLGSLAPPRPDPASVPVPAAQAMELRSRWEAARQTSDLKPGDLCVDKPGLGSLRKEYRGSVIYIVWRMLDPDDWLDREIVLRHVGRGTAGIDRPDCLIGDVSDGDGVVAIRPHQLSQLERWGA